MKRKAIIVGVNVQDLPEEFEYTMEELRNLAEACNLEVCGRVEQNLQKLNPSYYIGTGKLEELKMMLAEKDADLAVFDDELSATQIRNLESELDCEVMDRTMLILEIFANRAKTRESQLQVETARLKYMLPRLIGMYDHLGRQGGRAGLKNRGAGETKLELDRRKIEIQIANLNKELERIVEQRHTQRKHRKKNQIPVVSLAGYTNAGKSTIMNAMVERFNRGEEKQVFEKNMLFATLETSVRKIKTDENRTFLLTDTVGFIKKLPHHLVKAFRSTLEEVIEADLIIHVIDYSNPNYEEQKALTNDLLRELGVRDVPVIYAYNKADLTNVKYPEVDGNEIFLSAKNRIGIDELTDLICQKVFADFVYCEFLIPYTDGEVVSYFNEHSSVLNTEYEEAGTRIMVECSKMDAERFSRYALKF